MSWVNQEMYTKVQTLPEIALESYISDTEWTVAHILRHIVDGAEWFAYCLTGRQFENYELPTKMSDVEALRASLVKLDALIAAQADLPDELLTIAEGEKSYQNLRSTIVGSAIYHAIEHRTQMLDALEFKGYKPFKLENFDLWTLEYTQKNK